MSEIFIATESGSAELDGQSYNFTKGITRVRAGHPLLKACPDYFAAADAAVHYEVEQATKAPGEKRGAKTKAA